jgi:exodeoxyribonuclease VII large subunit
MLTERLEQHLMRRLERWRGRIDLIQARLDGMNPLATLARGYAIVRHEDGRLVRGVQDAAAGDILTIQLGDGLVRSKVVGEGNR